MRDGSPWTWRRRFIRALRRQNGHVVRACSFARVPRETVYRHRAQSAAFAAAWEETLTALWRARCEAARAAMPPRRPLETLSSHELLMALRRVRPDKWGFISRAELRRDAREQRREGNRRAHADRREAENFAHARQRLNKPAPTSTAPDTIRPRSLPATAGAEFPV